GTRARRRARGAKSPGCLRGGASPAERDQGDQGGLETITHSEALPGELLARCIKTGTFCAYRPDPAFPLAWEFAKPLTESAEPRPSSSDQVFPRADRAHPLPVGLDISPFARAQRTAFVGRDTECGTIRALLERALSGQGAVILLAGSPGVGK